jgi:uncharacterized protein (TIGR03382 family)
MISGGGGGCASGSAGFLAGIAFMLMAAFLRRARRERG